MNGPAVAAHGHTVNITTNIMININARSTKAEILAAYETLQREREQGATWPQVQRRITTAWQAVARELPLLVKDCYQAGATARQWVSSVLTELSRPVLR